MARAQGLSLNTIVIAALVLVVLVVLVVILTGQVGRFGGSLKDCSSLGGECQNGCNEGQAEIKGTNCPDDYSGKPQCCISVLE